SSAGPAAYLIAAAGVVVLWRAGEWLPVLGPLHLVTLLWEQAGPAALLQGVLGAWLGWTAAALPCVGLAVWGLRRAHARHLAAQTSRQSFWKEHRPAVSDQPLCWKERYCEGRLDLPLLRWLPRSVLLCGIAALTLATSTRILVSCEGALRDPE